MTNKYRYWVKQYQLISLWLINSIIKEIVKKVSDCDLAFEIWANLENYFTSHPRANIMQYKAKLHSFKKCGLSLSAYVKRIQNLASQLAATRCCVNEE